MNDFQKVLVDKERLAREALTRRPSAAAKHAALARHMKRAAEPKRSIWSEPSAVACLPNPTIEQINAALQTLVGGCGARQVQLNEYREQHPLDPAHFETWLIGLHNRANHNAGKPMLSIEDGRMAGVIQPDRVVVLSLDHRNDRWQAITESAGRSAIARHWKLERYHARLPSEMFVPAWWQRAPTVYATGMDHRAILEESWAAGHKHVLVLEDDAILMDCFDVAYRMACKQLPEGWLGLWLSSDGHKEKPVKIGTGLVRCVRQCMTHAYLLNRDGISCVLNQLHERHKQVVDGATEDLHGREPNFYATEQNAVRQFGDRYIGQRTKFYDGFGS